MDESAVQNSFNDTCQQLTAVHFQHCMVGGTRNKWTTLKHWPENWLRELSLECDNNHQHEAWSVNNTPDGWKFDAAAESEHPKQLCQIISKTLTDNLIQLRVTSVATSLSGSQISGSAKRLRARIASGKQPRGSRLPPLLPEFLRVDEVTSQPDNSNCRTLRHFFRGDVGGSKTPVWIVGAYAKPEQFVDQALTIKHPLDVFSGLPDATLNTLFHILTVGPSALTTDRSERAALLLKRRLDLQPEEIKLHESFPEQLQTVLKRKNLLLMKELLMESGYGDKSLVDDIIHGFSPTGKAPESGIR